MKTSFRLFVQMFFAAAILGLGSFFIVYEVGAEGKSLEDIRLQAEQGDFNAQTVLGSKYFSGEGVPQNYKEAFKWTKKAAEQGSAIAQYNLACMYNNGQGIPQDYKEAVKWLKKAAEQGYDVAQIALGFMYALGQGVPVDIVKAYAWHNLGVSQGNVGPKARDFILENMPPQQIADGQKLWVNRI